MSSSHNAGRILNEVDRNGIKTVVIHYSSTFYDYDVYQAELAAFIDMMNDNNVEIIFVAPVPIYDYHIPKAMLQRIREPNFQFTPTNHESYQISATGFHNF